ncbi:MAG: tRNA (adenosine(37)-N6)-threonylcarbamoyltransferase complex dimerization subunit type 1 TsaB [Gammaproteobacteria bacterium]|uniref:tRNA (adenosine(37)-N6)-threonylcarbamoyltransferase complex dimerization subunit type 1 TsaB n=1 Tax=Pseudomaricurvus alcaniphilus TaxID=1166482 RepID=UPI00140B2655|nr:tRNA (adenosine(37)-N6)-threonylcarbamoyltransferase complex dimerization subunit type 1 TsaB [Pseudomaricurvus alcaniphilus]MBR9912290.1 tRNA (adenosine(37)-N6)-threonylcarbamoyltransferase complex dimerization subunit type 1 TsaB [Gammaproteobacteria bacterium]NHN39352.1 tRNA (adenosine(37)-N6)-threonylcarbamoyltransferase complex dimerization subunit type 1 TsaB [Pseudomaricurvus alcaniphilus]
MKRILAIDTSSDHCSIALSNQQGQIFASSINSPRQHSQKLLPLIDELLGSQQMALADIDAIAYGRGPGSFTGIRICLGVVQGLAYSQDIPVVPVSTLRAMAQGALRQKLVGAQEAVLVAVDARMDEVYWALYQCLPTAASGSEHGLQLVQLADEAVSPPALVAEHNALRQVQGKGLVCLGSGHHYAQISAIAAGQHVADFEPQAVDILQLAQLELEQGGALAAEQAQPVYLRDSVAWKKRQRIRN